jgi:hypothetical protein
MPGHFSDEGQSSRKNPPRFFGLRRKSAHTSLSALTGGLPHSAAFALCGRILAVNAYRPGSISRP